jgi:hypothetical protein
LFGDSLNEAFKMAAPRLVVELTMGKQLRNAGDAEAVLFVDRAQNPALCLDIPAV